MREPPNPSRVALKGPPKGVSRFRASRIGQSLTLPALSPKNWRYARARGVLSMDQGTCPPGEENTILKPPLMAKSLKGSKVNDPGNSSSIRTQVKSL